MHARGGDGENDSREPGTHALAEATEVLAAFSLGRLTGTPRYVARGAMGEIWRVETDDGAWAVKALFEWDPPPPRPADVEVQLAAAHAGIRIPAPVLTARGDAVVVIAGRRFRAYEWIELAAPLDPPVTPDRAAEAGSILGTIHSLRLGPQGETDRWYVSPPQPQRFESLATRAEADGRDWAAQLREQQPRLTELAAFADAAEPDRPIVCHRDFDVSNVLPGPDGYLVTLDWENAGPLDPAAELASALLGWTCSAGSADETCVHAVLDGYQASRGAPPELRATSFSVAVTTQLNFLAVMSDQALGSSPHADFADGRVRTLLDGIESQRTSIRLLCRLLDLEADPP